MNRLADAYKVFPCPVMTLRRLNRQGLLVPSTYAFAKLDLLHAYD